MTRRKEGRTDHCRTPRLQLNWTWRLFIGCFVLLVLGVVARPCEAASIQIETAAAQALSHCIVRTATGNVYAVILDTSATPTIRVYESTNAGSSWTQQDSAHAPSGTYVAPSAAIDGNGIIHIAYWNAAVTGEGLWYVKFSTATNTFSGNSLIAATSYSNPVGYYHTAIAVDSNNAPHVLYEDSIRSSPFLAVTYIDAVGGKWNRKVQIPDPTQLGSNGGELFIDQNGVPELAFFDGLDTYVYAAIGNANKATSFTVQLLNNPSTNGFWGSSFPGIAMDSARNTWILYLLYDNVHGYGIPTLVEHRSSDSWSTWQTQIVDSSVASSSGALNAALAISGTTPYVAYQSSTAPNNLAWQSFNGSFWSTVASFDQPSNTGVLKWSEYFNNSTANQIDVLITNSSGAYWNEITSSIFTVSPSSGPPETSVTITGSNFGSTQGTSTVTFNGIAGTPTSWNPGTIVVPVPAGATSGPVVVTVGGSASNGVAFTVPPVPSITSLSPTSGPFGTSVTISGSNFGTAQGTSTVTFNGVSGLPTAWGPNSITVPVPTGATSGPVVVTVNSLSSNGISFTVLSQ